MKNSVMITVIAVTAVALAALTYQLFADTSTRIQNISEAEIRSNTEIQAHDLTTSLSNKLTDSTNNLRILANAPTVQAGEIERARLLFDTADSASQEFVDFYMWLDKDGKVVWISNLSPTDYETYRGLDLSFRLYYEIPRVDHKTYYSSVTESNDKINRLYISYPILAKSESTIPPNNETDFNGVVVAGLRADAMGNFLERQLSPKVRGNVTLVDNSGIILYAKENEHIGKNVFGVRFQTALSSLDASALGPLNEALKDAISGGAASKDVTIGEKKFTIAYEPVKVLGAQTGALYMLAPHEQTADVLSLVAQQRNAGILMILVIAVVTSGFLAIITAWNKRLTKEVGTRTAELRAAYEQVQNHDKMQRDFINIAAHELRTPIQPILGIASLIESDLHGKETMVIKKDDLDMILRNARRLERLTSDLLQVARIEGNTLTLNKETFDLNEMIQDVVKDVSASLLDAKRGNVQKIEFIPSKEQAVLIEADRSKIFEVITNLLRNSIKFATVGTISISCERDKQNDYGIVKVNDKGAGIDPEIMPKLFTKFTSNSESGTGLGLFISKNIIEAHGGKIWAENNNDGKGVTFTFTLPLKG
jgi:signal transduction histidine kinase